MSKRVRKIGIFWLAVALVLFGTKLTAEQIFGIVLERVFEKGTACEVWFRNPRINFFSLTASIQDALIRHPSEPKDAGFRAKRISISLSLKKLFSKELMFTNLDIVGAKAHSLGTNTGFVQTLAFLFPERVADSKIDEKSWLARKFADWPVHVSDIRIRSSRFGKDQLIVGGNKFYASWNEVGLYFVEPTQDAKEPYALEINGTDLRVHRPAKISAKLGTILGSATIGAGRFEMKNVRLVNDLDSNTIAEFHGGLGLKKPYPVNVSYTASLENKYLRSLLDVSPESVVFFPSDLQQKGSLQGTVLDLKANGELQLNYEQGILSFKRPECAVRAAQAEFQIDNEALRLNKLNINDIVTDTKAVLQFDDELSFDLLANIQIDESKSLVKDCFAEIKIGEDPRIQKVFKALAEALGNSESKILAKGKISPLKIEGSLHSEFDIGNSRLHSQLNSEFSWIDNKLILKLNEKGVLPQMQAEPVNPILQSGKLQTLFSVAKNSNIQAELAYQADRKVLTVEKLEVLRYPTAELYARILPFISDHSFTEYFPDFSADSFTNVRGRWDSNFESASSSGEVEVEILQVGLNPFIFERISIPLMFQGKQLEIKNAVIETKGGLVSGSFNIDETRKLKGNFSGKLVAVNNFAFLTKGSVSGSTSEPILSANIDGESQAQSIEKESHVEIKLSSDQFRLAGELFDKAATIDLVYPLKSEKHPFTLQARLVNFPLDYLFPDITDANEVILTPSSTEEITANLYYSAQPSDIYSGKGELKIDRLQLERNGIRIQTANAVEMKIADQRLNFSDVILKSGKHELNLSGYVDRKSTWNARIRGGWELGELVGRLEGIEQVSGELKTDLQLSGSFTSPKVKGPLVVEKASMSLPLGENIVGIADLRIDSIFEGSEINIQSITAKFGDGNLKGSGFLRDIFQPDHLVAKLNLDIDKVVVEPIENLSFEVLGNLSLVKESNSIAVLGGALEVRNALYEDRVDLARLLKNISRNILGQEAKKVSKSTKSANSKLNDKLRFDLKVFAKNGLIFDTNIAQAELRADLHLGGSSDFPTLDGRVDAIEGLFGLNRNEFNLLGASLIFSPLQKTLDPSLSIVGETSVKARSGDEHQVRISITGSLTKPKVTFTSDGGLPQETLISLLGLGTSINAFSQEGRKPGSLLSAINPTTDASLAERLSDFTGFSSVQIDTALSPSSGEFVPRLVARRPLVGKVNLDIESELTREQDSLLNLEYPLLPYLNVIGGWRTNSVTNRDSQNSGTFHIGVDYKNTFPGGGVLPQFLLTDPISPEAE